MKETYFYSDHIQNIVFDNKDKLVINNKSLLELDIFVCLYRLLKKHNMQICIKDKDHAFTSYMLKFFYCKYMNQFYSYPLI